jgi:hypothetical protein
MSFKCNLCNKDYKSYQSLWNHNKKFHTIIHNDVKETSKEIKLPSNNVNKLSNENLTCINCNRKFNNRQAKWAHFKKCNTLKKNIIEQENELLKEQLKKKDIETNEIIKQKDKDMDIFKKQILDLINKNCKIHPKTLTKINKQLNTTNNILNDNKVINNNNIIIQFGREKLYEVFSKKEQIDVLNHGYLCLENLIEKAHFNSKYPQFKNILITNLQNNLAYKYNATTSNFDVVTKKELLEDIISERMYDIEEFFNNYKDDITPKIQTVIEAFINKMDNDNYSDNKKQNIKIILYNNREKVKRDMEIEV